jgi:hypothetical protein
MVAGSQVPNLLQPGAASTLDVSPAVDLVIPISAHQHVRESLANVTGYRASPDEPSVWLPDDPNRLEINFIAMIPSSHYSSSDF